MPLLCEPILTGSPVKTDLTQVSIAILHPATCPGIIPHSPRGPSTLSQKNIDDLSALKCYPPIFPDEL